MKYFAAMKRRFQWNGNRPHEKFEPTLQTCVSFVEAVDTHYGFVSPMCTNQDGGAQGRATGRGDEAVRGATNATEHLQASSGRGVAGPGGAQQGAAVRKGARGPLEREK